MTKDDLILKATSWCFANDIVCKLKLSKTDMAVHKYVRGGREKKIPLPLAQIELWINGRRAKAGKEFYEQGAELYDKIDEIYLYMYSKRTDNN